VIFENFNILSWWLGNLDMLSTWLQFFYQDQQLLNYILIIKFQTTFQLFSDKWLYSFCNMISNIIYLLLIRTDEIFFFFFFVSLILLSVMKFLGFALLNI